MDNRSGQRKATAERIATKRTRVRSSKSRRGLCSWPFCERERIYVNDWTESPLCSFHLEVASNQHDLLLKRNKVDMERIQRQVEEDFAAAAKQRRARERAENGVVYFLRTDGHIKIGWTSNLQKRMKSYSPGSQLMAVMPGTMKDEKALHKRFAHHRTHGNEWYPLVVDIVRHIETVVEKHGTPPPVVFAAKRVEIPTRGRAKSYTAIRGWSGGRSRLVG